jgi:hypothetical protein
VKTRRTIYTDDMLDRAMKNIKEYKWARRKKEYLLQRAQEICSMDDDFIWRLIPGPGIPRTAQVNEAMGCPNCGREIDKYGYRPWLVDVLREPWKIKCPSCGEVYPKNDFGTFYQSGLDESGIFILEKADRTLLFNAEYENANHLYRTLWVDDSTGYIDKEGNRFKFIGFYGFKLWEWILDSLVTLRDAYLYSGDTSYARKGLILLHRIANVYPSMEYHYWYRKGFGCSCGGSGRGRLYGCIWEAFVAVKLCTAWDAFFPCIDDDKLLDFLRRKGTQEDLRENIENNIVRHIIEDVRIQNIQGNSGMHQYAMAIAAIALDHPRDTPEVIRWLFRPEVMDGRTLLGGGLPTILFERMDRDGMGDEAAPGYNLLWVGMLEGIYGVISRYSDINVPRWWTDGIQKLKRSRSTQFHMVCIDRFVPNIGDVGSTGAPAIKEMLYSGGRRLSGWITVQGYIHLFNLYKDPGFLRMALYLNRGSLDGLGDDVQVEDLTNTLSRGVYIDSIFELDPERAIYEAEQVLNEYGPLILKSKCHDGYGLAVLRGGADRFKRALWLYFGRTSCAHGHRDHLNIGLYAFGLDLLPDLGYPENTGPWPKRIGWTSHTISHNTVLLDNTRQERSYTGHLTLFKVSPGVQVVEAKSDMVYPYATLYKRTVCMIDISEEAFYIVDFFRAAGAKDYYYSFHGAEGQVHVEGAKLIPQKKGTYAGPNVEYGQFYDGALNSSYNGSGFQYLHNVERDPNPDQVVSLDWDIKDSWGVLEEPRDIHLRLTLLCPDGEIALADGIPPQRSQSVPNSLKYMLLHRRAPETLGTSFVSIIEPYKDKSKIRSISKADPRTVHYNHSEPIFVDSVK